VRTQATTSSHQIVVMKTRLALLMLLTPMVTLAMERWISVGMATPPIEALLVDVGSVISNASGNRVTTVRSRTTGGYQLDTVTEFDCGTKRTRALASSLTDKSGRLISASGEGKAWFSETQSIGLAAVCSAEIAKP